MAPRRLTLCTFAISFFALGAARGQQGRERGPDPDTTRWPEPLPSQSSPIVVAGNARFTVVSPTLLRLEYHALPRFVDAPTVFAIARSAGEHEYRLDRHADGSLELDTGRMRLDFRPDGLPFHAGNLSVTITSGRRDHTWHPGDKPLANLGGAVHSLDGVTDPIDLGFGLLARDGWAIIDDSAAAVESGDWYADNSDPGIDWYLFGYGDDYRIPFRDLARISGPVPMPRRYQLGSWYSRWADLSSSDYRQIVDEFTSHGFPLDVLVLDMAWHNDGWGGWSWNRNLLPDAEQLLFELRARGLAVSLNLHPDSGVPPGEDRYDDFMRALGLDPATRITVPFDAGDRRYLDALYDEVQRPLVADGVDFWWLDWFQPRGTPTTSTLDSGQALNRYYFERTSEGAMRGAGFSRWAGFGDHRHPFHFSGDAYCYMKTLAFQIPFTTTSGNSGCFFWTHDIGGFRGPFGLAPYDEVYARWAQFGAFSAALRIHSFWDKRPWLYEPYATQSIKKSYELRHRLFPYLYTSVAQSSRDTWPLLRPMYLAEPRDGRSYRNPLQYFFGDHVLVAPITGFGTGPGHVARRPVWLPDGTWYQMVSGERVEGGREILVSADLDELPVFVRAGVPIPMQPEGPRMAATPTALIVGVWPGEDGSENTFTLYEDDGITSDYKLGAQASTELRYTSRDDEVTIDILPTLGSYVDQPQARAITVELNAMAPPRSASVDGLPVLAGYDPAARVARVTVPSRPIRQGARVVIVADTDDPRWSADAALVRRLRGVVAEVAPDWDEVRSRPDLPEPLRNATLALKGYGVELKNEGLYLYQGEERFHVYAPDPVATEVFTFRRSSWSTTEERFPVATDRTPVWPLRLDVELPPDAARAPFDALGERRTRGLGATFADIGTATWTTSTDFTPIGAWHVHGPVPAGNWPGLAGTAPPSFVCGVKNPMPPHLWGPGWRTMYADAEGVVDLAVLTSDTYQLAYAYIVLRSAVAQEATLAISSDDGAIAWLDGVEIYRATDNRPLQEPDLVKVALTAGDNALMLEVHQAVASWQLRVGVESQSPLYADLQ